MKLHHIENEFGFQDIHWYTDLEISRDVVIRNLLIDTGASISTLNIRSLARIYKQREQVITDYLRSLDISDKLCKCTATNESIVLHGVYLRNVLLGDSLIPVFKVYTRLDGYVSNLIGMDIISACYTIMNYNNKATADIDFDKYAPNVKKSAEIKRLA